MKKMIIRWGVETSHSQAHQGPANGGMPQRISNTYKSLGMTKSLLTFCCPDMLASRLWSRADDHAVINSAADM